MDEELRRVCELINEQGLQISQIAKMLELQVAVREAQSTIIQAMIPFVAERDEFKKLLKEVHHDRLQHHLGQDVSNHFILNYTARLNGLLPAEFRFPEPSPFKGADE